MKFTSTVFSTIILAMTSLVLAVPAMAFFPIFLEETDTAGFVGMAAQGPLDTPVLCTSHADFTATFGSSTAGLSNPYLSPSVAGFFANGGTRCYVVRVAADDDASVIGTNGGPGMRSGLQVMRDLDEVATVVAPGMTSASVQTAMIALCQSMGERVAILDPASPSDIAAVQAQRAILASDDGWAALYFPWVQAAPTGTSLLLPPSGFVAGWYSASEPADSPIGAIATATGLAYNVTSAEQDILNPLGINAIRNLSGIRIWGARTLATDPEMIYVAVRRTSACLRESITKGTLHHIFDVNDFLLWDDVRQRVRDFLHERWLDGWLQGQTADDAYFAQCGLDQTMTEEDIQQGRLVFRYGVALVRPAEFLVEEVTHQLKVSGVPSVVAGGPILHPAAPNPFNPMTTLRYSLDRDCAVSLRIYDPAGRLVRKVLSRVARTVGDHQVPWNGRDDSGRAVPSGVYLVHLEAGKETKTQRILLAR
jgi:phage tail sheath protein FI